MSTHIPDNSVSKSQAATPGYKPPIENHTQKLKEINKIFQEDFKKWSEERGNYASIAPRTEFQNSIEIDPKRFLYKLDNLTDEMKKDLDSDMTAKEFCEKYKDSIIKDMGL